MNIQVVEHEIYKSILGLTEYEQVYPMPVIQTINRIAVIHTKSFDEDDKLIINTLISNIEQGIRDYLTANPQFKRISKGVVIDMFAYYSTNFKSQYKNVYIERQVSYTAQLYIERLIGYFAWLRHTHYSYSDVYEKIVRYNNRERKHITVEANIELNNTINCIYKSYIELFKNCSNLSKGNVLNILYTVRKQYFPAP